MLAMTLTQSFKININRLFMKNMQNDGLNENLTRAPVIADFAAAHVGLDAFAVLKVAAFRTVGVSAIISRILKINYVFLCRSFILVLNCFVPYKYMSWQAKKIDFQNGIEIWGCFEYFMNIIFNSCHIFQILNYQILFLNCLITFKKKLNLLSVCWSVFENQFE
jgi:hypothetical protein